MSEQTPWVGTTFTIDTRDVAFGELLRGQGKSLDSPAEFFERKWYQQSALISFGEQGYHGVFVFQRLEEVVWGRKCP